MLYFNSGICFSLQLMTTVVIHTTPTTPPTADYPETC